ncbi:MAG: VWA domain-containing protein, partial [Planctomycetaceae bacterium]|nr:VWA domain-containing protein [Planctomycetaceae bacterium]
AFGRTAATSFRMSLIHPALIYAAGLAVIPVILHFLLRAKPRKLPFPALRLILMRRRQNVRRLKLRHVWLMLLRMLVIVGLAIAAARPSLPEASYELSTREMLTLFGVIAAALGTYFGLMRTWQKRKLSVQTLAYRRTMLRGGLGTAVVALIALAVILPYVNRLRAEISAPAPAVGSDLPVAAVFLFDASLSMQYTQEGKTRLDQGKAIALSHMDSLPPRSRIAVGETNTTSPILFQADLVGAKAKIQSLAPQPVSQPLNERLRAALALQEQDQGRTLNEQESVPQGDRRDRFIREVYVFTDLAANAWRTSGAQLLKDELQRLPWVAVYVIDVGELAPHDVGITDVTLSRQSISEGSSLTVEATISAIGVEESEKTVELSLISRDGKRIPSGQQPVKVAGQQGARVQIPIANLQGPVQHGELRLLASDPLAMNDVRYFTVEIKPPPKVLLVSPTASVGELLTGMLATDDERKAKKFRFRLDEVRPAQLSNIKFGDYSVVVLNSVPSLSDSTWKSLHKFVSNGGGLAVILGSNGLQEQNGIDPVSYSREPASTVLPCKLGATPRFSPPAFLDAKNPNHPVLKKLDEFGGIGVLAEMEIYKRWTVDLFDEANVLITYSNAKAQPALIERRIGGGRVALLTTAADTRGWIDHAEASKNWAFIVFVDQLMQYLSGRSEATFNYLAGEEVLVRADNESPLTKYLVRKPSGQQLPGTVPAGAASFAIRETDQLGHYGVSSADPQSKFASGFSVNATSAESDFRRLSKDDLTQLFGEKRFSLARDIAALQRHVNTGRLGEEVYPLLLIIVLIVFCGEHFVANWFYAEDAATTSAA